MKSIEAFAKKGEKGILKNIFKGSSDSDDDDQSEEDVSSADGDNAGSIKKSDSFNHLLSSDKVESSGSEESTVYTSVLNNFRVMMHQQREKGIAHQLWPAATLLCNYIEKELNTIEENPGNKGVLELGAGVGLCGIVCSYLGFKQVVMTDLPVATELLNENIALNESSKQQFLLEKRNGSSSSSTGSGSISADVLSWGNNDELDSVLKQFDEPPLVIAADCVYWEHLFEPLFITVRELVVSRGCEVIICHVKRWKKDEKFFKMCRRCMAVEVLSEVKDMIPAENTGIPQRRISRILRIKANSPSSSS